MMWLLMLACASEAPPEWSCTDLDDPAGSILEAWDRAPGEAEALLLRCEDSARRRMMLESLLRAHPGQTAELCERLPDAPLQSRCVEINSRPHLWEERAPITHATGRAGGGPSSMHPSPDPIASELGSSAVAPACDSDSGPSPCLSAEAATHARSGRAGAAWSICRLEGQRTWINECLFGAAEAALTSDLLDEAERYGDASALCLEAGDFRTHCLAHVHLQWARAAPPAETATSGPWEVYLLRGDVIMNTWIARGQDHYGRLARDYYWSELAWESMARSRRVVGNPLDHLPAGAHPHLRAAAVFQLMSRRQLDGESLETTRQSVERILSERNTDTIASPSTAPERARQNLWPEDQEGEDEIPATFYLGVSRRAMDRDPDVDLVLCILEAAARMTPARQDLLEEGTHHAHPLIRWTAQRLSAPPGGP